MPAARLSHRSVIRIAGSDRHAFLQGLVSNDVMKVTATNAIYAALLTPQGKFLHDLFILDADDGFLVDCEAARADDVLARLAAYKLRAKVTFETLADKFDVWAVWGEKSAASFVFADPRLPELGERVLVDKGTHPVGVSPVDFAAYDAYRLRLGIADGSRDLEVGKSTLAEGNFEFLHGVDWKKGCYVGQELTARMHYRGLAKRRLFPLRIEGESPVFGAALADDAGEMRSSCGAFGLALLKIDAALQAIDQNQPLTCGLTTLYPTLPGWMKIDAQATTG